MKAWGPSLVLILLMFLLIAATRVYVGGPDGLEFVWKGELNFTNTVVIVSDFAGIPRSDLNSHHPEALLSQMEDMGLLPEESPHKIRHHHLNTPKLHEDLNRKVNSIEANTQ